MIRFLARYLDTLRHFKQSAINHQYDLQYRMQRLKDSMPAYLGIQNKYPHARRAILSTNYSPDYLFCAPLTILFWNRLCDYNVALIIIGNSDEWREQPLGNLVLDTIKAWHLKVDLLFVPQDDQDQLSSGHLAQVMRLWAPMQFPEDFCLISDIDMLPLNFGFFDIYQGGTQELYLLNGDAYSPRERWCMCYVGAKGDVWKDLIGEAEINAAKKYFGQYYSKHTQNYNPKIDAVSGGLGWFNDESILSEKIIKWQGYPRKLRTYHSYKFCSRRRIQRSLESWQAFEPSRKDYYVDAHIYRECYHSYDAVGKVMENYVPNDANNIKDYVDEWNRRSSL